MAWKYTLIIVNINKYMSDMVIMKIILNLNVINDKSAG